jgi:hypothetical protein
MPGFRNAIVMTVVWCCCAAGADAQGSSSAAVCKAQRPLVALPALPEASGLALGANSLLWMHNDSGAPELIAVTPDGSITGRLTLNGARVDDWEALASGPCGNRSCLYVGDIGDNDASRKQLTIYRVAQPAQANGSARVEAFHATYPDGAHDAEALLVSPDETVFIVTKGDTGPIAVYKFPRPLKTGATMQLERVGTAIADKPRDDGRVTDGAFSADGKWVVLRTNRALTFYRGTDFMRGDFTVAHRVDLSSLKEPQGEAVVFGSGNTLYVGGEGGGKKQPGTLAVLSCDPN